MGTLYNMKFELCTGRVYEKIRETEVKQYKMRLMLNTTDIRDDKTARKLQISAQSLNHIPYCLETTQPTDKT